MIVQSGERSYKKVVRLIKDRCAGAPYDVELYVNIMDRIMKGVYRDLGHIVAGPMGLDLDTFMNYCWSRLEDDKLIYKLADISFDSDTHFLRYVRKVFENLFREKASRFSPGFRARQKQMERVLRPLCVPSCRRFCGCWRLKETIGKPCSPASFADLSKAIFTIPVPRPKAIRSTDKRYPPLRDKDMAVYLLSVLRCVGGMATHQDMLALIIKQFVVSAIHVQQDAQCEDRLKGNDPDELILGPDHEAMAKEFIRGMDPDMIDIHYFRIAKDYTIAQTAKAMNKSIGTVHNREGSYKRYISRYFTKGDESMSTQEMSAIMALVTKHVITIKEAS